jgi:hypothetical protein
MLLFRKSKKVLNIGNFIGEYLTNIYVQQLRAYFT